MNQSTSWQAKDVNGETKHDSVCHLSKTLPEKKIQYDTRKIKYKDYIYIYIFLEKVKRSQKRVNNNYVNI